MPSSSDQTTDGDIERAFELLRQAKLHESAAEQWDASHKYAQAMSILRKLAQSQPTTTDEERQIAALYAEKWREYTERSYKCLVAAMEAERQNEANKKEPAGGQGASGDGNGITNKQAKIRNEAFYALFSKPLGVEQEDKSDQQWSLEERLQELNKSLPSSLKSDEERMADINRGLRKLGLSLHDQKPAFSRFLEEAPKSEDEQVDDIIAQANEEARFDQATGTSGGTGTGSMTAVVAAKATDGFDDDLSEDDSDDANVREEEALEAEIDDRLYAMKKIRTRAGLAQAKLAQLVAYLDEAITEAEKFEEDDVLDVGEGDDNSNGRIRDNLAQAKKKLGGARKKINEAIDTWIEDMPADDE